MLTSHKQAYLSYTHAKLNHTHIFVAHATYVPLTFDQTTESMMVILSLSFYLYTFFSLLQGWNLVREASAICVTAGCRVNSSAVDQTHIAEVLKSLHTFPCTHIVTCTQIYTNAMLGCLDASWSICNLSTKLTAWLSERMMGNNCLGIFWMVSCLI